MVAPHWSGMFLVLYIRCSSHGWWPRIGRGWSLSVGLVIPYLLAGPAPMGNYSWFAAPGNGLIRRLTGSLLFQEACLDPDGRLC